MESTSMVESPSAIDIATARLNWKPLSPVPIVSRDQYLGISFKHSESEACFFAIADEIIFFIFSLASGLRFQRPRFKYHSVRSPMGSEGLWMRSTAVLRSGRP